jgi:cyclopropane fatty-acyl-phospholipid synthase-like methyltransferase
MVDEAIYADGTYLANNPGWHEEDSPWKAEQIARILRDNGVSPTAVTEIGCGAGGILHALARHYGPQVELEGYEISPQAFDICKRTETGQVKFFLGDPLAEPDARFDVVLVIDVIEHMDDYFALLRRLRGRARFVVFHIPLDLSVQTVLRSSPILKRRATVGHIHYFTKETALATLQDTGYDIVAHFYTKTDLELANRGWKANLMKLPRRLLYALHRDIAVRLLGGFSLMVLAR